VKGPAAGQEFLVEGPVITIGRDSTNAVPLADASVSRLHCKLVLSEDRTYYQIVDCDSFNGTYVNGSRVDSMRLVTCDQFKVGSSVLEIRSGVSEADSHEVVELHAQSFDQRSSTDSDATELETVRPPQPDDQLEAYTEESEQQFVETTSDLDFVYDVSLMTSKNLKRCEYSRELLRMVVKWAQAEQGVLILLGEDKTDFSEKYIERRQCESDTTSDSNAKKLGRFNRRLVNHVIEKRSATLATFSVSTARDLSRNSGEQTGTSDAAETVDVEAMCVPIDNDESLHALIYLDNYRVDGKPSVASFSMEKLRVLVSIANQAAARFENQKYVDSLVQTAKMSAVGEMTSAISHRVNNLLQLASGGSYLVDLGINQANQENIARGWEVVKQTQNRISLLSTNLSVYSRPFDPYITDTPLRELIQQAVENIKEVYDTNPLRITNDTPEDLVLHCDAYFTRRAIENLLVLALAGVQDKDGQAKLVKLEVEQEEREAVLKVGFYHHDERFNLASLYAGDVSKVNAELGMLELLVSRKVVEGQGSSIRVTTDSSGYNVITARIQIANN
jgi:pSer/pThr/pTyr-binding forkhead associated (FHA) protein/signal transduction histidine kinase